MRATTEATTSKTPKANQTSAPENQIGECKEAQGNQAAQEHARRAGEEGSKD